MDLVLAILISVGVAAWVAYDARHRDFTDSRFADRPWKWVVGCTLLWPVLVLYLMRRNSFPARG